MHHDHDIFVGAIDKRRKILLTCPGAKGSSYQTREMVPMDHSPGWVAGGDFDCYHFWDFEHGLDRFPLVLFPNEIVNMKLAEDSFDPADFVKWDTRELPWFLERDWGQFS